MVSRRVLFVCLVLALNLVSVLAIDGEETLTINVKDPNPSEECQAISFDGITTCDSTTEINDDCYKRCCKSSGKCFSSSCVTTFGAPNDAKANCEPKCQEKVKCNPYASCNTVHCLGFVECLVGPDDCEGALPGDPCLYDGTSDNFKICDPDEQPPEPSSSTGPGGFVVGDPQFVGLRGQSYQVHGVSGEVYNIVSDGELQYNSRFVFLDRGDCPVVKGKKQRGCFSHPGSYLGELGLKTRAGDKIHYVTGNAANGFTTITVNDKPLEVGETVLLADDLGFVSFNNTHLSTIQIGNWQFDFENSDLYVNQRVKVFNANKLRAHGLLGQTWRDITYPNAIKFIQGEVDDYVIRDGQIFGDDFVFNAHN